MYVTFKFNVKCCFNVITPMQCFPMGLAYFCHPDSVGYLIKALVRLCFMGNLHN